MVFALGLSLLYPSIDCLLTIKGGLFIATNSSISLVRESIRSDVAHSTCCGGQARGHGR